MNATSPNARWARLAALLVFVLAFAGCGDKAEDAGGPPAESSEPAVHLLKATPGEPISVLQALETAEGDAVVVAGRVSNIENGFAAFSLTDVSVPYCGQDEDCGCTTPWDYCCHKEAADKGRIPVELRSADGQPVADANTGLRLLDVVVLKGTIGKTESGGKMLIVEDGWFRKERPVLPKGIEWPN